MSDVFTDLAIRISRAEPDELRAIFQREIQTKIWTDEEREALLEAHDKRASYWNQISVGMTEARWKGVL